MEEPFHAAQDEAVGPAEVEGASSELGAESRLLAYTITSLDGAELRLELDAGATVLQAHTAAAAARGLPWHRVRLVAKGQQKPLERYSECLEAATGGLRDLLLVASSGVWLAGVDDGGIDVPKEVTFEHFPDRCFVGLGCRETERFAGRMFGYSVADRQHWHGVKFWRALEDPTMEAAPLWGKVMLRVVLHVYHGPLGVGVGTREMPLSQDPEYRESFFGLYHGGASTNVCAAAKRVYRHGPEWHTEQRLAVLLDLDEGTMQCYHELEEFGPLVSCLPKSDLWPVIVMREGGSVSLSVESTMAEAGPV